MPSPLAAMPLGGCFSNPSPRHPTPHSCAPASAPARRYDDVFAETTSTTHASPYPAVDSFYWSAVRKNANDPHGRHGAHFY